MKSTGFIFVMFAMVLSTGAYSYADEWEDAISGKDSAKVQDGFEPAPQAAKVDAGSNKKENEEYQEAALDSQFENNTYAELKNDANYARNEASQRARELKQVKRHSEKLKVRNAALAESISRNKAEASVSEKQLQSEVVRLGRVQDQVKRSEQTLTQLKLRISNARARKGEMAQRNAELKNRASQMIQELRHANQEYNSLVAESKSLKKHEQYLAQRLAQINKEMRAARARNAKIARQVDKSKNKTIKQAKQIHKNRMA